VKGEGNEGVLRELLTKFISKRYGIGIGVVIDRRGNQSRQYDIVIYDNFLYPSLLSLTTVHLFPVDLVYPVIEVKTTLDSESAKESLQNVASVKQLDYVKSEFTSVKMAGSAGALTIRKTTPPHRYCFRLQQRGEDGRDVEEVAHASPTRTVAILSEPRRLPRLRPRRL